MPSPVPPFPQSAFIRQAALGKPRMHKGDGDMWPLTWASDNSLYGGAGDNMASAMNFWRITGEPLTMDEFSLWLVNNKPVDHRKYCDIPPAHAGNGIKPAGLLSLDGTIYMAVEAMNYGECPAFNRQRNIHGWIVTTTDFGVTWNVEATPTHFFTGRLSSCHFVQYGRDCAAPDGYVYTNFPAGDDGNSYWENGDCILLGRVPQKRILDRAAWEFWTGLDSAGRPVWNANDALAQPILSWPRHTGENHISYNPGLKRFVMGNYAFYDPQTGGPRPYHQLPWPQSIGPSQLTLLEAPNLWGPWSMFFRLDDWGTCGGYQPNFPVKWMSPDGLNMWMVSSGTFDDYNFTAQRVTLTREP